MKRFLIITFLLVNAQLWADEPLPKFKISIGMGWPNLIKNNTAFKFYEGNPGIKTKGTGPLHLKFEYKIKWWLGLGLNVNYVSYGLAYVGTAVTDQGAQVDNHIDVKYKSTTFNLRSNFYFINPAKRKTKSELYLGLGVGYKIWSFKVVSDYPEQTIKVNFGELYNFGLEATCGYRFNFNRHLAIYSEIGIAKSIVQLGLTGSF